MTNKEFYGDKLLAIVLKTSCRRLHNVVCDESCVMRKECKGSEFYNVESVENWLKAEHVEPKPPLLENGDGLKPGDWIMVRNYTHDNWKKERFMCYFDGHFFTTATFAYAIYNTYSPFAQARLPMEGE